jgi:hypothetical protein
MLGATTVVLACDGCFVGYPAVISFVIITLALVGSIYMLLASNFGARVGYLITATSLFAFLIILSLLWLIGAPGTTTATGPRGREPAWIPFMSTSDVARLDFPREVADFPGTGWDERRTVYPGRIDSRGELQGVRTTITTALANEALVQGTGPTDEDDWAFRPPGRALTPAEEAIPEATIRYRQEGNRLLFGVTIPATSEHREVTVFAFRDKGLVYLTALMFLVVSLVGFVLHLWLLARHERKQVARDAELEGSTVTVGVPL